MVLKFQKMYPLLIEKEMGKNVTSQEPINEEENKFEKTSAASDMPRILFTVKSRQINSGSMLNAKPTFEGRVNMLYGCSLVNR